MSDLMELWQKDHELERLGRPGEFWATRFAGGWSVFGWRSGLIVADVDRDEAERWLRCYELARSYPGLGVEHVEQIEPRTVAASAAGEG